MSSSGTKNIEEGEPIENDSGWQTVDGDSGDGKGRTVRQRRTYTVPASSSKKNNKNSSKKSKPLSKQEQIRVQRQQQRRQEHAQTSAFAAATDNALSDLMMKYLKTFSLILLIGLTLLLIYAPHLLAKWAKALLLPSWLWQTKLTARSLVTVYPLTTPVRAALPLFTGAYAIKTADNAAARAAVSHVAALRRGTLETSDRQVIRVHSWEHAEFIKQTTAVADMMERFCGPGFRQHYMSEQLPHAKKDDLMLWCFLANGHHDGFVKYEVQSVQQQIVQGTKGVAVVRYPPEQKRIHSESWLFLPLHNLTEIEGDTWIWSLLSGSKKGNNKKKNKLAPTTLVAYRALEWLNVNAGMESEEAYRKLFEQLLYECIVEKEMQERARKNHWYLLHAACTPYDRRHLMQTQLFLGSTCPTAIVDHYDNWKKDDEDEEDSVAAESTTIPVQEMDEWATCCTIHDPNHPASFRYQKQDDQDNDEDDKEEEEDS